MLNQRLQNDVRITLIYVVDVVNLFSTKFQRRNDVVCPLGIREVPKILYATTFLFQGAHFISVIHYRWTLYINVL